MHFHDFTESPPIDEDCDHAYMENFNTALRKELSEYGGNWEGAAGGFNYVARIRNNDGQTRILKVPQKNPQAQTFARAECATLNLINNTEIKCPVVIPRILRHGDDPYYLVLSDVAGEVLRNGDALTSGERFQLGRSIARVALWETCIDTDQFIANVAGPYGKTWDWYAFFKRQDNFDYSSFPSLGIVAEQMRALRDRYYPVAESMSTNIQFIQSDMRLPNLAFKNSANGKVLDGVFDWGVAQLGNRAHEARGIFDVGVECILGYNAELKANNQAPVDPEEVRLWSIGRCVGGLVWLLKNKIPNADDFLSSRNKIVQAYPELDWSEFKVIDKKIVPIHREAGPPLGQTAFV